MRESAAHEGHEHDAAWFHWGLLAVTFALFAGSIGLIRWLGDHAFPGRTWLAVLGFIFAVVGAVTVAWSGAVEAGAQAESGAEKAPA